MSKVLLTGLFILTVQAWAPNDPDTIRDYENHCFQLMLAAGDLQRLFSGWETTPIPFNSKLRSRIIPYHSEDSAEPLLWIAGAPNRYPIDSATGRVEIEWGREIQLAQAELRSSRNSENYGGFAYIEFLWQRRGTRARDISRSFFFQIRPDQTLQQSNFAALFNQLISPMAERDMAMVHLFRIARGDDATLRADAAFADAMVRNFRETYRPKYPLSLNIFPIVTE